VPIELKVNEQLLEKININESVKLLGVHMTPTLKWEKQFKIITEKMQEALYKLKSIPLSIANTYMYYNMYLMRKVYFRCGIITIMPNQEKILMKISKSILLRKMDLSKKFPRKMLYARKSALGVELMKPLRMVAILSLKLYMGHVRAQDRIANIIKINEENTIF